MRLKNNSVEDEWAVCITHERSKANQLRGKMIIDLKAAHMPICLTCNCFQKIQNFEIYGKRSLNAVFQIQLISWEVPLFKGNRCLCLVVNVHKLFSFGSSTWSITPAELNSAFFSISISCFPLKHVALFTFCPSKTFTVTLNALYPKQTDFI